MKAEIYNALADLNRGADLHLASLAKLQAEGVLPADYVDRQHTIIEETRAGNNSRIHDVLGTSEVEEWAKLGKMRLEDEERLGIVEAEPRK